MRPTVELVAITTGAVELMNKTAQKVISYVSKCVSNDKAKYSIRVSLE